MKTKLLSICLAVMLIFSGCVSNALTTTSNATSATSSVTSTTAVVTSKAEDSTATYDTKTATEITFSSNKIAVKGTGASAKGSILTITNAGTYVIKGTLKAGQIVVAVDKKEKVHLVLNGVTLTSESGPAIWIQSSEKVIMTLVKGTVNTLSDSKNNPLTEGEDEPDATIFSQEDLSINGEGALIVKGNMANGIKSKDTLLIMNGTLQVSAVTHALNGKDAVGVFNGTINLTSGEDGIHSSNQVVVKAGTISVNATDDGIHGDLGLVIDGGTIKINKSNEGLESTTITMNNGNVSVVAKDDGINAAESNDESTLNEKSVEIIINGGTLHVNAEGDGIDANGSILVTGGKVSVSGPTNNGNGALDYDQTCEVTGGSLTIAGSAGMAQSFSSSSKQNSILVYYTTQQKAKTVASLLDSTGKTVITYTPEKAYQTMLFSTSKLVQGQTYTLVANGVALTKITLSKVTTVISDQGTEVTGGTGHIGGRPDGNTGIKPNGTGTPMSENDQL